MQNDTIAEHLIETRESLARVEVTINLLKLELLGNGHPGRVAILEKRLARTEHRITKWYGFTIGAVFAAGIFSATHIRNVTAFISAFFH